MQQYFQPIIGFEELSSLLKRTKEVLKKDRCERPHTVPPAYKPPETKNPLWITEDVISWLREHPEDKTQPVVRKGAPTKRERIAKRVAAESINNLTESKG